MDRIGRYKIVRELGRGAMGVVYHAIDPNIGRPVAIKTIQLGAVRAPDEQKRLRERLFREARSAGILSHPGIVTVYDVEQQGDVAYIAMEFVDGPTLDQVLSTPQPIPSDRMFSILGQTANALDFAHQKGIVHRDIKPANIMIAADGTAKITDFGIAKITASEQFTMTGSIVGTPHYMSPEQIQGQNVDGRSDQFSLAVIAYEMLTGEKPYTGEHLTTVVYKIVAEEPVAAHRINPSLSRDIENVLRKGLAKKPDARYRTCGEFAEALEKACIATRNWKSMPRGGSLNEPTVVEGPIPAMALPPARPPRRASDATTTAERVAKRKSGFLPFLLAILMAAALLAMIGWQWTPWSLGIAPKPAKTAEKTEKPALPPEQVAKKEEPPAISTAPPPVANPAEVKPSPMGPPEATEPRSTPKQVASPKVPQEIALTSSPGGATATLDGRSDSSCKTPCSMTAPPGRHIVAFTLAGYELERRDVDIGTEARELPVVILRPATGTLMLSSSPPGAAVLVNGKPIGKSTPAAIQLPAGSYKIGVEKDGRQGAATVDIRNNGIKTLTIVLGQ